MTRIDREVIYTGDCSPAFALVNNLLLLASGPILLGWSTRVCSWYWAFSVIGSAGVLERQRGKHCCFNSVLHVWNPDTDAGLYTNLVSRRVNAGRTMTLTAVMWSVHIYGAKDPTILPSGPVWRSKGERRQNVKAIVSMIICAISATANIFAFGFVFLSLFSLEKTETMPFPDH